MVQSIDPGLLEMAFVDTLVCLQAAGLAMVWRLCHWFYAESLPSCLFALVGSLFTLNSDSMTMVRRCALCGYFPPLEEMKSTTKVDELADPPISHVWVCVDKFNCCRRAKMNPSFLPWNGVIA